MLRFKAGLQLQKLQEAYTVALKTQARTFTVSRQHGKAPPSMPAAAAMPDTDFQPAEYKGMSYEKAREIRTSIINPAILEYYKKPIMFHQGHMQWLFDQDGKRYLDLFSGIVTVSVGHCHPKVNKALHEQIDKIWHTTNVYMIPAVYEYAEKLVSKMPGNLKTVYFVNSGTEANDLALNMARLHTGAHDLVSLSHCYVTRTLCIKAIPSAVCLRFPWPTSPNFHSVSIPVHWLPSVLACEKPPYVSIKGTYKV